MSSLLLLATIKRRRVKLGNLELDALNTDHRKRADVFALRTAPVIGQLQAAGFTILEAIRDELNHRNVLTARNGRWQLPTVHKLMKRIERVSA